MSRVKYEEGEDREKSFGGPSCAGPVLMTRKSFDAYYLTILRGAIIYRRVVAGSRMEYFASLSITAGKLNGEQCIIWYSHTLDYLSMQTTHLQKKVSSTSYIQ